jgi:hypothetical protein
VGRNVVDENLYPFARSFIIYSLYLKLEDFVELVPKINVETKIPKHPYMLQVNQSISNRLPKPTTYPIFG